MSSYILCHGATNQSLDDVTITNMVKRSRSAAELPRDDHVSLVPDIVNSQTAQDLPEARGAELIEEARTNLPTSAPSSAPATSGCSLGELNRINPAETHDQFRENMPQLVYFSRVLESVV
jgi:hypothetical protein